MLLNNLMKKLLSVIILIDFKK